MKYFIPILFLITACTSHEIDKLDFPFKKNYKAVYFTKNTLFKEDGSVRISQSDTLYLSISKDLSEKGNKSHEWLMLPGMKNKDIPDTIVSVIDQSGYYNYFSADFLPEGTREIKLITLPLKQGSTWQSAFLSFPAKASYLDKDSIIQTKAGEFKTFAIRYEFSPYYMNELLNDQTNEEVRAVLTDYYSMNAGKVFTQMEYFVTDRKSGKRKWKILANQSILIKLTIPE